MEKYKKVTHKQSFKISAQTWNDKFKLPVGYYSVSDIQDYFENITKNQAVTGNLSIRIYINEIENRITFKIKTRYYLKL